MPEELLTRPETPAAPAEAVGARLGFYGKMPARGDFLGRRLPRSFIDPWDAWLQEAVQQSRVGLGEEWLSLYLTGPMWRFAIGPGTCGADGLAGVLMPSVDRVGRYFPLTLAVPVGTGAPMRLAIGAADWFVRVEELALRALDDNVDFDQFDAAVGDVVAPEIVASPVWRGAGSIALDIDDLRTAAQAAPDLIDGVLSGMVERYSLWWTSGSERVRPSFVAAAGLPQPTGFAALLDGDWERWGWNRP